MFTLTNHICYLYVLGLSGMFIRLNGTTRRNVYEYFAPRVRLDICKRFISFFGVCVWLQRANDMKCAHSLDIFKHLCFSNLSEIYCVI